MKKLILVLLLGFAGQTVFSQTDGITAKEASIRIGNSLTVKDKVFGGRLLNNGMTVLNLGGEFPNHQLVVMIKSEDISKFSYKPEEELKGKPLVVAGIFIYLKFSKRI